MIKELTNACSLFDIDNPELNSSKDLTLNKESIFMDIGSGSGMVVLHVGTIIGCHSIGIEVNPIRVDLSLRIKDKIAELNPFINA